MRDVAAMILAAGLGTRLRPLSDQRAKALVPVGDRPALGHILEPLRRAGVSRIVVNAHHRAADLRAFAAQDSPGFTVSEERDLLGTAGGVRHAGRALGEGAVLVWNGDIVLLSSDPLDLEALFRRYVGEVCEAMLVVRPRPLGLGNVGIDAGGHVVRLRAEAVRPGELSGGEFLGIHVLGGALRAALPERGCLVGDVYLPALRAGSTLRVFCTEIPWHDIGGVTAYLGANAAWLAARGLPSWHDEGAQIAPGVSLSSSIVGRGAIVDGQGSLDRCVVWPGAHARAPLTLAVVTPEGVTSPA